MKNEEIDEMIKEAPGPINFTVFLTMFGEKLKGERALGGSVGTNTITNILSHLGKPHSSQGLHHPSTEIPQMVLGCFRWELIKESKQHWLLYCVACRAWEVECSRTMAKRSNLGTTTGYL